MLALDITCTDSTILHVINIYAPNNPGEQQLFFQDIMQFFTTNMVLLGDFNSMTVDSNHLSGNLDPTSAFLRSLL